MKKKKKINHAEQEHNEWTYSYSIITCNDRISHEIGCGFILKMKSRRSTMLLLSSSHVLSPTCLFEVLIGIIKKRMTARWHRGKTMWWSRKSIEIRWEIQTMCAVSWNRTIRTIGKRLTWNEEMACRTIICSELWLRIMKHCSMTDTIDDHFSCSKSQCTPDWTKWTPALIILICVYSLLGRGRWMVIWSKCEYTVESLERDA